MGKEILKETTYPLITIAIPTYNRADNYLKQAIQCAINQTYSNVEIVISDNCSMDNTESSFSLLSVILWDISFKWNEINKKFIG